MVRNPVKFSPLMEALLYHFKEKWWNFRFIERSAFLVIAGQAAQGNNDCTKTLPPVTDGGKTLRDH
jgi:hypothetical protein